MSLFNKILKKYKKGGIVGILRSVPPYLNARRKNYTARVMDLPSKLRLREETYDIYEEQWDLLIVLDGCRYDVLESVSSEYAFLDDLDSRTSPASSSREWLGYQFRSQHSDEIAESAYITGNTFSNDVLGDTEFELLDEVWKYGWDKESGIVLPRPLTDRAISVARNQTPDRLIVHYMQPHFPSLEFPDLGGKVDPEENRWINSVWKQLETDELSYETVWNAYKSNLHNVLSEVELLLNNSNFDSVIITADHGNGFGERGIYGHPSNRVHPCLRTVPWVRTTANDTGNHTPEEYDRKEDDIAVNDRLAALGYL